MEARHQLGEVAGTEVAQLDLEHTDAASMVAAAGAEVAGLRQAVVELCGDEFEDPRSGDLEALDCGDTVPRPGEIQRCRPGFRRAHATRHYRAEIEDARAKMAAASAWGRPVIEAEWEHFPDLGPVPGYDAWGFRFAVPLPLGSTGARQRAAARERQALAVSMRDAAARESLSRARTALAAAEGAELRLIVDLVNPQRTAANRRITFRTIPAGGAQLS